MGIDKLLDESKKTHTELRKRGIRHLIGGDYGFAWSKNGTNARDLGLFRRLLRLLARRGIALRARATAACS